MKVKCEYCGNYIDDTSESCPKCGATNDNLRRTNQVTPTTVAGLKQWCDARGLTPEKTRFFVGEDYREPKAFGIYQNDWGEYVVYKNKANGQRAIRYQGRDEAYAVNELWMRLQEEILNQKAHILEKNRQALEQQAASSGHYNSQRRSTHNYNNTDSGDGAFVARLLLVFLAIVFFISMTCTDAAKRSATRRGYYQYDNRTLMCLRFVPPTMIQTGAAVPAVSAMAGAVHITTAILTITTVTAAMTGTGVPTGTQIIRTGTVTGSH